MYLSIEYEYKFLCWLKQISDFISKESGYKYLRVSMSEYMQELERE